MHLIFSEPVSILAKSRNFAYSASPNYAQFYYRRQYIFKIFKKLLSG
ncbi:hypothetical protein AB434_1238 [Heyndrickxia coagulans]|uniref:Uncharacterized protein n=1 Tax=Heyndrickxia coagulans TaxID=1398 RepID=A0A0C5CGV7_HEYCO|nr:hypothetical protein SB48_HM08orf06514 [Heyndrickxia coagulans]AKN53643.1 hypothetical protein AB434_1238 [Heyndrickxia coagulans]KWZ83269.1 hypothetical protein HMPREF3213_01342 [Heyndrickxia coagulans]KYC65002.1 hypothetical protein B4100_1218 [Heyndrickxia coagulans]